MIAQHFNIWLIYFFFYCIAGWIFESVYVSAKNKRWINRGFLKGPWLPLYGSGAIIILLATLPFQKHPIEVYFVGLIAATTLEYVIGVGMLKLFKVRYWDYRYRKIQFQGQICLVSSIAWGFLSLLMVYVIHRPLAELVQKWNQDVINVLTFVFGTAMTFDFAYSFRDAMDLRKVIIQMEKLKKNMESELAVKREELAQKKQDFVRQLDLEMEEFSEKKGALYHFLGEELGERRDAVYGRLSEEFSMKKENLHESVEYRKQWMEDVAGKIFGGVEASVSERKKEMEALRQQAQTKAEQLLLQNPSSLIEGMDEETKELRSRLLKMRKKKEE